MKDPNIAAGAVLALCAALACAACGQKGDLYLPDTSARDIVTRPTQSEAPPLPAPGQAPNSPETVDAPDQPPSPAPEVTEPKEEEDGKPPPK